MGLPVAAQGVLVTYKLRECNGLGSKGSIHHHVVRRGIGVGESTQASANRRPGVRLVDAAWRVHRKARTRGQWLQHVIGGDQCCDIVEALVRGVGEAVLAGVDLGV